MSGAFNVIDMALRLTQAETDKALDAAAFRYGSLTAMKERHRKTLTLWERVRLLFNKHEAYAIDGVLGELATIIMLEVHANFNRIDEVDEVREWLGTNLTPTMSLDRARKIIVAINEGWTLPDTKMPWDREDWT